MSYSVIPTKGDPSLIDQPFIVEVIDLFGKANQIMGLWYSGNTRPWHGRVRGPTPRRSTIQ